MASTCYGLKAQASRGPGSMSADLGSNWEGKGGKSASTGHRRIGWPATHNRGAGTSLPTRSPTEAGRQNGAFSMRSGVLISRDPKNHRWNFVAYQRLKSHAEFFP
jgi:hypothetical protein